MSTIYIVRHGEAENGADDGARHLTSRGRGDVEAVAKWAKRAGLEVDEIVHSGKNRAEETASIFARELAPSRGARAAAGLGPEDDVRAFAVDLMADDRRVMVVGHLPFVARLVNWLTIRDEGRPFVDFGTATLVRLEGSRGEFKLSGMMRPELIADERKSG